MELWHGSPEIVWTPLRGLCRPYNDYGPGFTARPMLNWRANGRARSAGKTVSPIAMSSI